MRALKVNLSPRQHHTTKLRAAHRDKGLPGNLPSIIAPSPTTDLDLWHDLPFRNGFDAGPDIGTHQLDSLEFLSLAVPELAMIGDHVSEKTFSLHEFCGIVSRAPLVQHALIKSTECYVEDTLVRHRYLVVKVAVPGVTPKLWLRIDRLRTRGNLALFLFNKLTAEPNDTARFSASKDNLLELKSHRENIQKFGRMDTMYLGDFCLYLQVMMDNLDTYVLYKENCWLFASVIQQLLGGSSRGDFIRGHLPRSHWAPAVRTHIEEEVNRLYGLDPPPFSVAEAVRYLTHVQEFTPFQGALLQAALLKCLSSDGASNKNLIVESQASTQISVISMGAFFESLSHQPSGLHHTNICGLVVLEARKTLRHGAMSLPPVILHAFGLLLLRKGCITDAHNAISEALTSITRRDTDTDNATFLFSVLLGNYFLTLNELHDPLFSSEERRRTLIPFLGQLQKTVESSSQSEAFCTAYADALESFLNVILDTRDTAPAHMQHHQMQLAYSAGQQLVIARQAQQHLKRATKRYNRICDLMDHSDNPPAQFGLMLSSGHVHTLQWSQDTDYIFSCFMNELTFTLAEQRAGR